MEFNPTCAERVSAIAQWELVGAGGFISLRTKESIQLAVGQVKQLKGCEKMKGASLVGSAFLF